MNLVKRNRKVLIRIILALVLVAILAVIALFFFDVFDSRQKEIIEREYIDSPIPIDTSSRDLLDLEIQKDTIIE